MLEILQKSLYQNCSKYILCSIGATYYIRTWSKHYLGSSKSTWSSFLFFFL